MSQKNAPALAMELFSAPTLASRLRRAPIPDDVLVVIKAAAGDEEAISRFPAAASSEPTRTKEIASFYLQQVFLRQDASDHQVLGLPPLASIDKVKEHKRWLLKWLHPDRNNNRWEQAYFERISGAAQRLEQGLNAASAPSPVEKPPSSGRQSSRHFNRRTGLNGRSQKHLPQRRRRTRTTRKWSALLALFALALMALFGHQLAATLQSYFGGSAIDGMALGGGN